MTSVEDTQALSAELAAAGQGLAREMKELQRTLATEITAALKSQASRTLAAGQVGAQVAVQGIRRNPGEIELPKTKPDIKVQDPVEAAVGELFETIKSGVKTTTEAAKIDFSDLGGSIKTIFKGVGQSIHSALSSALGSLVNKAFSSIFDSVLGGLFGSILPGVFGKETGGRVAAGRMTLVGERGPELIVPDGVATVKNAADTGRILTGRATENAAARSAPTPSASETKVIINNHSGAEATASRRRGPDGGDIIDIVIARVAQNLSRGGEIADAAALRFGLSPQGT